MFRVVCCIDESNQKTFETGEKLDKTCLYLIDEAKLGKNVLTECYRKYKDDDIIYSGLFLAKRFRVQSSK